VDCCWQLDVKRKKLERIGRKKKSDPGAPSSGHRDGTRDVCSHRAWRSIPQSEPVSYKGVGQNRRSPGSSLPSAMSSRFASQPSSKVQDPGCCPWWYPCRCSFHVLHFTSVEAVAILHCHVRIICIHQSAGLPMKDAFHIFLTSKNWPRWTHNNCIL
jgi:hypothetical protein